MSRVPNKDLAATMAAASCSRSALARDVRELAHQRGLQVHCDHVDVGRWLSGMQPRDPKPVLVAEALGRRLGRLVTLDEIGLSTRGRPRLDLALEFVELPEPAIQTARTLWSEDLTGADYVRNGLVSAAMLTPTMLRWLIAPRSHPAFGRGQGVRVGTSDIDAVRATVHMFEDLDHRFGGGHVRTAAVQYLSDTVVPLLQGTYTDLVGRDLAAVVSQFTYKTGAMAYDVGRDGLARRYFVQALNLAHLADDRALGGKVLALMSHQANHRGEYQEALDLARAAKLGATGKATPTVQAMYAAMEARALASLGDSRGCVRALREAERFFERRNPADDPDWIGYFDEAELHDEIGHCFVALRQATDAEHHVKIALKRSDEAFRRSRTFSRLSLASAHVVRKDVEQACHVAEEALRLADQLKSARVKTYVRRFDRRLSRFDKVPAVSSFRRHAATLLAAAS